MLLTRTRIVVAVAAAGLAAAAAFVLPGSATADDPGSCTATPIEEIVTQPDNTTTIVELEVVCTGDASAAREVTVKALGKELVKLEAAAQAAVSARGFARATVKGGVTEVCVDDPDDQDPPTCITI